MAGIAFILTQRPGLEDLDEMGIPWTFLCFLSSQKVEEIPIYAVAEKKIMLYYLTCYNDKCVESWQSANGLSGAMKKYINVICLVDTLAILGCLGIENESLCRPLPVQPGSKS